MGYTGDAVDTGTPTYGHHSLALDIGFNNAFRLVYVVENAPYANIGVDILQRFNRLVDAWTKGYSGQSYVRRSPDRTPFVNQITPQHAKPQATHKGTFCLHDHTSANKTSSSRHREIAGPKL